MKMYKITFLLITFFSVVSLNAQHGVLAKQQTAQKPVKKTVTEQDYKAHAAGWMVDLNKAYDESKRTGKPILANFTGTDWCGWCIKLKREVFDKPEFKAWAKKNVILMEIDFPRRFVLPQKYREQNAGLQQAFKVTGYPTIWVFNLTKDAEGKFNIAALGKTGYVSGVKAFTGGIDEMIKAGK